MSEFTGVCDMRGKRIMIGSLVVFGELYDRNGNLDYGEVVSFGVTEKRKTITVECSKYSPFNDKRRSFHLLPEDHETPKMMVLE